MPLGGHSQNNVGIRRVIASLATPQFRNFEANGSQLYVVMDSRGHDHGGTHYAKGATVAYDDAGGTKYTNYPVMEREFNKGMLDPAD